MKTWENEYYGDNVRWFVANVIDNTPPYGLEGRVKIRIHGIHTDIADESGIPQRDLPWAQVMNPGDTYGVSGLGTSTMILPGALVWIFLRRCYFSVATGFGFASSYRVSDYGTSI